MIRVRDWFRRRRNVPLPAVIVPAAKAPVAIQKMRHLRDDHPDPEYPDNFREPGLRPVADIGGDFPS